MELLQSLASLLANLLGPALGTPEKGTACCGGQLICTSEKVIKYRAIQGLGQASDTLALR